MTKNERRIPKFRRRAEARPDEVLDAALDLFIEKGFAATRVEDIAKRAGISKGSVYLYFSSKEALFEGLVKRAIAPFAQNAMQMVAQFEGHPRVAITALLSMLAVKLGDSRVSAIPKLIMREGMHFPKLAQMYRHQVLDEIIPVLTGLIARGIKSGHLRPVDPELTIRSIVGPVIVHLLLAEVFQIVPSDGIAADRLVENHLSILFDGLSAPAKGEPQ